MQPYHTEAVVNSEGKVVLSLPFPVGKKVEVVVLPADESVEENAGKELAAKGFLRDYSDEDSTYDSFVH